MDKKKYAILVLGLYMIFEGIMGIGENIASGLPIGFKILNWAIMLFYVSVGFFLVKVKNWARITALIFASVFIGLFAVYSLYQIHSQPSLFDARYWQRVFNIRLLWVFIIQILTIYYFMRPAVKEQFK